MAIEIIEKARKSIIVMKFPQPLSETFRAALDKVLTGRYRHEILSYEFTKDGLGLDMLIRRNPESFQTISTFVYRFKASAEGKKL